MATDPKRVQAIFLEAAETEDSVQRAAILDRECAAEPELRQRVEELLRAHAAPDSIVDGPSPLGAPSSAATVALEPSTDPQASSKTSSTTSAGLYGEDEYSRFDFLQTSTKPGSIGRLEHYEILQVIGKGGFGTVLKAFDEKLHRVVAIKILSPELAASATARNRFIREARAAAAVTHDHVVTIHVVDEVHRPPYLVMQLIDGVTLQQKLDKVGPLSLKEILRIGIQMAEGLAAAHKQGLVHRDIKPANILLENGIERVKITDFGLARAVDDASVTQSGTVAGTPLYMSPEQANGLTLDHRSDLFSLGTVLYVMCTGRPPFRASGTMAVLKRVIDDVPRPVREIHPEIPDWLEAIIAKLHAKKPEDRFQTAKEVAELLSDKLAALQSTGRADWSNAPTTMPAPKSAQASSHPKARAAVAPLRRVRTSALFLAIAALVIVPCVIVPGGLVWYFFGSEEFGPQRRKEVIPRKDDNLIVKLDDPALRVSVLAENGDEHLFPGDHQREERFNLEPGRYQVKAMKKNVLVFQEWVTLGGEPMTIQVNSNWVQLFNGKDLTGWKTHPEQPGLWQVEAGEIVGSTGGGPVSHLYTTRGDFTNFHLRAEVKINRERDSGIHFRCTPYPEFDLRPSGGKGKQPLGYEANIAKSTPTTGGIGSIWRLGAQGKVFHRLGNDVPIEPNTWFLMEIVMRGNHIVTKVNGKTVDDFRDGSGPAKGHFALEAMYAPTRVNFRKIEIKELPSEEPAWVELFNGKDLNGWIAPAPGTGKGEWHVDKEFGQLGGRGPQLSYVFTERDDYADFHLKTEVSCTGGTDSAIFFRCGKDLLHETFPAGYEAYTGYAQPFKVGALLLTTADSPKALSLSNPQFGATIAMFHPLEIIARGNRIIIKIDGKIVTDYTDDKATYRKGRIALQVFSPPGAGGGAGSVTFKKIEIKELPMEEQGWIQLFNGKNLNGWKLFPADKDIWSVKDSILIGQGAECSMLPSERSDFRDFHLRVEAKINEGGDSGVWFRTDMKSQDGYEANINHSHRDPARTGSLGVKMKGTQKWLHHQNNSPAPADVWFTLEVIATGPNMTVKVNGVTVAQVADANRTSGHIGLEMFEKGSVAHFRKIEIKELPPTTPPLAVAPFNAAKAKEHQDAWAKHLSVDLEITNSIGMKLRIIPPGEFLMGTPANDLLALLEKARETKALDLEITRIAKEGTQHPVRLTQPYYIGTCEVTRAQFARFVQATGYKTDIERNGKGGWSNYKGEWVRRPEHVWSTPGEWQTLDDEPVVQVTWNDAKAFCDWLSQTEGRSYVLPTEAQWEFACRAGTTDLTYAEPGRPLKEYAWTSETLLPDRATHHPKQVGLKKMNAFGLHDMLGNVWEHCNDWYEPGPTKPDLRIDPVGPMQGFARSVRGGAWYREGSIFARCGGRSHGLVFGMDSEGSDAGIGFRIAIIGDLKSRTNPATWVALFNGMDLTGWQANQPDKWKVENGAIIGQGNSYLSLKDKKFADFHCRLEAKINADGWGGLAIRNTGQSHGNISICPERGKTGSLYFFSNGMNQLLRQPEKQLASPDTWLTLEVIVQGKNVVVLVNGAKTAEASIDGLPDRGPIFLNADAPGTVIHFRKVEIKELASTPK